jgi:hypothetical protein
MSAPRLPATSGLVVLRSATGSSKPRTRRSASIKSRSANGLYACVAMPSSPIPSVSPTKSSCYARAPALPPKASGPKDFPRGSPECSRRWSPIMPDATSRVSCTAESCAAVGRAGSKLVPEVAAAQTRHRSRLADWWAEGIKYQKLCRSLGGTEGSNPSPSSGESVKTWLPLPSRCSVSR